MTTLYLAGRMSGLPDSGYPAFRAASEALRKRNYTVLSPHETHNGSPDHPGGRPWYLREAIRLLLRCDSVAVLPGWEHSNGAKMEVLIAQELGMNVQAVDWFDGSSGWDVPAEPSPGVTVIANHDEFEAELMRINRLHTGKRADYTAGGPLLANFQFASAIVGLSTEMGMVQRMAEKFWRLRSLLLSKAPPVNESIDDTYSDIAIIALLCKVYRKGAAYADKPLGVSL